MEIITSQFKFKDKPYRVTQFRGGKLEIYRIEKDGLEMFIGYVSTYWHEGLATAAWNAFQQAPGQRWLFSA